MLGEEAQRQTIAFVFVHVFDAPDEDEWDSERPADGTRACQIGSPRPFSGLGRLLPQKDVLETTGIGGKQLQLLRTGDCPFTLSQRVRVFWKQDQKKIYFGPAEPPFS